MATSLGVEEAHPIMPPRKVRRSRSAPQDVEGNHSLEPSHNNVETSIPEVTIAHLIKAMKDLKEN